MASGISYLIFIGSLTVRFHLSDYKLLVIDTIKNEVKVISMNIKVTSMQNTLSYEFGCERLQVYDYQR